MPNPEGINQYTRGGASGGENDHAHPAKGTEHAAAYAQARARADHASAVDRESRIAGSKRPTLARAAYHAHLDAAKAATAAGDQKSADYHRDRATYHSFDIPARRGSESARQNAGFRSGDFGAAMGRPGTFFKK